MNKKPYLILVAGASASGKSTVSEEIVCSLKEEGLKVLHLCQDRFYVSQLANNYNGRTNYDHPNAFDWDEMRTILEKLLANEQVPLPIYDYTTHSRSKEVDIVQDYDVIILEGLFALYDQQILAKAIAKIFVDTPPDECLIRRLTRDMKERKRSFDSVINQWRNDVRAMYREFIEPTRANADIILPWTSWSNAALVMVKSGLKEYLKEHELL